jgi:hypothetical protein
MKTDVGLKARESVQIRKPVSKIEHFYIGLTRILSAIACFRQSTQVLRKALATSLVYSDKSP